MSSPIPPPSYDSTIPPPKYETVVGSNGYPTISFDGGKTTEPMPRELLEGRKNPDFWNNTSLSVTYPSGIAPSRKEAMAGLAAAMDAIEAYHQRTGGHLTRFSLEKMDPSTASKDDPNIIRTPDGGAYKLTIIEAIGKTNERQIEGNHPPSRGLDTKSRDRRDRGMGL